MIVFLSVADVKCFRADMNGEGDEKVWSLLAFAY